MLPYSCSRCYIYLFFLQCHRDIELNPCPKNLKSKLLSVCHWNLNSITAHNYSKLTQLKAYISLYKYDFICLSETYLDSETPDNLLEIDGYNLFCADHPDNIKRGRVCIYYKESLPVRIISLPYLKESLLSEINDKNKNMIVSVIYCSSSQSNREFLLNFEQLLSDISTRKLTITGNFNARSSSWWSDDINILEGTNLYWLTSSNGFSQSIN